MRGETKLQVGNVDGYFVGADPDGTTIQAVDESRSCIITDSTTDTVTDALDLFAGSTRGVAGTTDGTRIMVASTEAASGIVRGTLQEPTRLAGRGADRAVLTKAPRVPLLRHPSPPQDEARHGEQQPQAVPQS